MAFPTYREHGVLYCRGIDPIMPFGLFRGVDQGGWDPNEHKFNMYTIVIGAQTLHATGYAMGMAMDGKVGSDDGEAVIVYFGDGASAQGDVNESFVWASVYNAPLVFFCQNNQYAISQPSERQTRVPLFMRANGFGFSGVRVDGNDVLACYAVTKRALDDARHGQGPSLIEAYTYRMGAHTTSDDPSRYRFASEVEAWQARDPILRMRLFLEKQGVAGEEFFAEVDEEARVSALSLRERVLSMPDPDADRDVRQRLPQRLARARRAARAVRRLPRFVRGGCALMSTLTIGRALNEGLRRAMERDPKVLIMGEDVGKLGGVFRITDGLQKDFGEDRVIDTPLGESGIIGTAVGLSIRGYRPVCEIQFDGFVYPAYDQIVSQVAKMHYRSQGKVRLPMVIRIPFGGGIGAVEHHSESPEAYFAHTAGLKVVSCAIGRRRLLDDPAVDRVRRPDHLHGAQAALLGEGRGQHRRGRALAARVTGRAVRLRRDRGRLRPDGPHRPRRGDRGRRGRALDRGHRSAHALAARHASRCTSRCGAPARLVVVHEAPGNLGMGAEIAARVTEQCFYSLEAPVLRVTGYDTPYPAARH